MPDRSAVSKAKARPEEKVRLASQKPKVSVVYPKPRREVSKELYYPTDRYRLSEPLFPDPDAIRVSEPAN